MTGPVPTVGVRGAGPQHRLSPNSCPPRREPLGCTLLRHDGAKLLICQGENSATPFLSCPFRAQQAAHIQPLPTHPAIVGQQDGVTLDVAVDDTLGVEYRQRLEHCQAHGGNLFLVHPAWAEGATGTQGAASCVPPGVSVGSREAPTLL